ncbi:MAG: PCMD domain-containing protein [Rikenellaceae bacterium]
MKSKFLSLLAILFVSVSCSNDEKVQLVGTEFDGVYKGTLNVEVNDKPLDGDIPQKVYISKSGEGEFKAELRNFVISDLTVGDVIISGIDVVKSGDNCQFSGNDEITLELGTCNVTVEGSITGETIDMNILVNVVDIDDMDVNVAFEGEKMEADQSSEAEILTFTFDMTNEANSVVTSEPVIDGTNITFSVLEDATAAQLKSLVPTITISENATLSPSSDSSVDFASEVEYTVTSEDGIYSTTYKVSIAAKSMQYTFDTWEAINYLIDFEQVAPMDILESANRGTAFLSLYGFTGDSDGNKVNTIKTEGVSGNAAKLITFDTRAIANSLVPGITAGTLYMGTFNVGAAMTNRLAATEFGVSFDNKEPLVFKGSYKYTPGETYYDASDYESIQEVEGKVDECSIMAVLFEVEDDTEVLTGVDINTSDKRIAIATLVDGTAKKDWTSFEIPFELLEGKTYDSNKNYKITFVCTSSKDGDSFKGAPGSVLCVDEFEIVYKSH